MSKFNIRDMMSPPEFVPDETAITQTEQSRGIDDITAEINFYKQQTAQNIIEIGRRLIEAKDKLPHGEWLPWLRDRVELTASTAQRFMQIAREFSNTAPVRHLSYTKVLTLLQLPTEDRDQFFAASHLVDGEEKTVAEMSKRELEKLIKERNEEKQKRTQAESKLQELSQSDREKTETIRTLEQKNRKLEARPVEVAVREPDSREVQRMYEQARADVFAEIGKIPADPSELPPELLDRAAKDFGGALATALSCFDSIAQIAPLGQVDAAARTCVDACEAVIDSLRTLAARAKNLMYSGDASWPDDEEA